ncbi:MAG: MFS transporter [Caldilineaceae bacterium]|nr:MFS transporter [Caldilineaceae bacterium]
MQRIRSIGSRVWQLLQRGGRAIWPGDRAWRGAAYALFIFTVVVFSGFIFRLVQPTQWWYPLGLFALLLLASLLAGSLVLLVVWLFMRLPRFYRWALLCTLPLIAVIMLDSESDMLYFLLGGLVVASLSGGALASLLPARWSLLRRTHRVMAVGGLVVGLAAYGVAGYWLFMPGVPAVPQVDSAAAAASPMTPLSLPDPSAPGPYEVRSLSYGSGRDRNRPEFGAGAQLITQPVDGSAFLAGWDGVNGWFRDRYWGFRPKELPLNGAVWYPAGDGIFPLVLVVHGNHQAEDFSDQGYAYLGEHLASRGFIVVSVDENFLNTSVVDFPEGLKTENDARGWLLLEHLRQWQAWSRAQEGPFAGKVDLNNIALIGHSRGGEAVAVAAAFNRLPYYPDNASVRFDFNFAIRSVIALAPIDGQYRPARVLTPLNNINYLLLQGAYDGDVSSYAGWAQYERLDFTESGWFKSAVYIDRANHGQFNSLWGDSDTSGLSRLLLNRAALMPAVDQQRIAKIYIGAFLETTLQRTFDYRPLFRDHRRGAAWLPNYVYVTAYEDGSYQPIAGFEEDIDLTTATLPGSTISAENLTSWREQVVTLKWATVPTRAAYVGWHMPQYGLAAYRVSIPQGVLVVPEDGVLTLDLADTGEDPLRFLPQQEKEASEAEVEPPVSGEGQEKPLDLTVELVDAGGNRAQLPLSHVALVQPLMKTQTWKPLPWDENMESEIVFQRFELRLADFSGQNPEFSPERLAEVRLLFDRTEQGVVALAGIGIAGSSER